MATILVVDDEMGIRELLAEILYDEGHLVLLAENAEQARQQRNRARPDLVLLDIWMPDTDGVTLLKEWALSGQLNMPVIMMSGHASIDTAVEATRIGALDFLEKPITLQRLLHTVQQGLVRSNAPDIKEVVAQMSHTPATHTASAAHTSQPHMPATQDAPTATFTIPNENAINATPLTDLNATAQSADSTDNLKQIEPLSPTAEQLSQIDLTLELREARDCFERIYFEYHLNKEHANITRVAERTGLERTHLYRKLKQLGIAIVKPNKKH